MLSEGEEAPDFRLADQDGREHRLQDLLGEGPVMLLFYPNDHRAIFSSRADSFHRMVGELMDRGMGALGVTMGTPKVNRDLVETLSLPFPLLSDREARATKPYDVMIRGDMLSMMANRAVFLVDREGRIAYAWSAPHPGMHPDREEVRSAGEALL
ncbi:MAG: peroxiredoxin family protein [Methanomassiliicoccales archaeon]